MESLKRPKKRKNKFRVELIRLCEDCGKPSRYGQWKCRQCSNPNLVVWKPVEGSEMGQPTVFGNG